MAWGQPQIQQQPQGQQMAPGGAPQPGMAPQQVMSPNGQPYPQGQAAPQGQPQFETPHPTVQYGQALPPQGQASQMAGQPQAPAVQMDPRVVLDGPGVPPELRGKTFGQAMRIYGALANDWLGRQGSRPPEQSARDIAGQAPQGQPPAQQQLPAQQQGQQSAAANFFRDPASVMEPIVERVVQRTLQPMIQSSRSSAIEDARKRAQQMVPDWGQLEADIMENIQGATPEVLVNPEYWVGAADLARGRNMRTRNPQGWQQQQPPQQPPAQQTFVPAGSYPMAQPWGQSFTEGPSAPSIYASTPMGVLTPQEQKAAQAMGMTYEAYAAWKGGVNRGR